MKVESESEVAQSCLTLHDPMDCSLPGSSVHGIFLARLLEWGAIAFFGLKASFREYWEAWNKDGEVGRRSDHIELCKLGKRMLFFYMQMETIEEPLKNISFSTTGEQTAKD